MTVVKQSFPPFGAARSIRRQADGALPTSEMPRFNELEVRLDTRTRTFWQYMKPTSRPSFTFSLLTEMRAAQRWVESAFAESGEGEKPIRHVVMASKLPGIFNLGGDLPHFVELIRAKDKAGLRRYAHACIDVQHPRATNMGLPLTSISLVQGDALGGGFECALAADVIVAEKSAKFGLPEILFNLFPGMGAYSLLARRIGPVKAESMILSGRLYQAEELKALGVVDIVVEDGRGVDAIYDYIEENDRRYAAICAVHKVRRMVQPISREEMIDITDLWVETAFELESSDLRKMERLAAAQDRRWAQVAGLSVAAE